MRGGRQERGRGDAFRRGAVGSVASGRRTYMRLDMTRLSLALSPLALLLASACTGDQDIAQRREAARQDVHDQRVSVPARDPGATIRDTALPARYATLEIATVEEVAEAIEAIPIEARRIRTADAIRELDVRLAPEPIVIGPRARGDLQIDNTAPLETIRNAVEGSALAYSLVRRRGVVIADIVAARLEGDALTLYVAVE